VKQVLSVASRKMTVGLQRQPC